MTAKRAPTEIGARARSRAATNKDLANGHVAAAGTPAPLGGAFAGAAGTPTATSPTAATGGMCARGAEVSSSLKERHEFSALRGVSESLLLTDEPVAEPAAELRAGITPGPKKLAALGTVAVVAINRRFLWSIGIFFAGTRPNSDLLRTYTLWVLTFLLKFSSWHFRSLLHITKRAVVAVALKAQNYLAYEFPTPLFPVGL